MQAEAIPMAKLKDQFIKIPPFQRIYSWTEKEWRRLWQELGLVYFEGVTEPAARTRPVFLGALVRQALEDRDLGGTSSPVYALIDGQQRLVTLALMAAALRDSHDEPNSNFASQLNDDLLFVRNEDVLLPRLSVQAHDEAAFAAAIDQDTGKVKFPLADKFPGSKIAQCYDFYFQQLSQPAGQLLDSLTVDDLNEDEGSRDPLDDGERVADQSAVEEQRPMPASEGEPKINGRAFKKILMSSVNFVDVRLSQDEDFSSEIFETLNDTGLKLSPVDLFRNGYFLLLPASNADIFADYWEPMEVRHRKMLPLRKQQQAKLPSLESFFFDEAIRRFGWTPKESTYGRLMSEIRGQALRQRRGPDRQGADRAYTNSVTRSLRDIQSLDCCYRLMLRSKRTAPDVQDLIEQLDEQVEQELGFLSQWASAPSNPLILELLWQRFGKAPSDSISNDELYRTLHLVSAMLVRRCVGGVPPQQLRSLLSEAPKQLRNSINQGTETVEDALSAILRGYGEERIPSGAQLRATWEREVYRITGRKKQLALALWSIEKAQGEENAASLGDLRYGTGATRYSIEHVMPQGIPRHRPRQSGRRGRDELEISLPSSWGDDLQDWGVRDPFEFYRRYRHTLANLTLALGAHNSSYGTASFADKKRAYEQYSKLSITRDSICKHSQWGLEDLRERAMWLIDQVCAIWPLGWEE